MIIEYPFCKIKFSKNGNYNKNVVIKNNPRFWMKIKCDKCGKEFFELEKVFNKRKKLLKEFKNINEDLCGKCSKKLMSSIGGIKGQYDENGNLKENKGRFSSERVKKLTEEEYKIYCEQRKKAAESLHNKLTKNSKLFEEHYKKIFKNSKIGYISKSQKEIYELLKDYGFELEQNVEGLQCDIVNFEKKFIIEFNGDFWHCNPKFYKPDYYHKIKKSTAKEIWKKDRAKNFRLRRLGYQVIVIWEYEWNNEKEKVIKKIKDFIKKDFELPKWWEKEIEKEKQKKKWMKNLTLKISKRVSVNEIDEYLKNGWKFGRIFKKGEKNEITKN